MNEFRNFMDSNLNILKDLNGDVLRKMLSHNFNDFSGAIGVAVNENPCRSLIKSTYE